jgi:hypothetical protein
MIAEITYQQPPAGAINLFEVVLFAAGIVLTLGVASMFLFLLTRKAPGGPGGGTPAGGSGADSGVVDHDSTNG